VARAGGLSAPALSFLRTVKCKPLESGVRVPRPPLFARKGRDSPPSFRPRKRRRRARPLFPPTTTRVAVGHWKRPQSGGLLLDRRLVPLFWSRQVGWARSVKDQKPRGNFSFFFFFVGCVPFVETAKCRRFPFLFGRPPLLFPARKASVGLPGPFPPFPWRCEGGLSLSWGKSRSNPHFPVIGIGSTGDPPLPAVSGSSLPPPASRPPRALRAMRRLIPSSWAVSFFPAPRQGHVFRGAVGRADPRSVEPLVARCHFLHVRVRKRFGTLFPGKEGPRPVFVRHGTPRPIPGRPPCLGRVSNREVRAAGKTTVSSFFLPLGKQRPLDQQVPPTLLFAIFFFFPQPAHMALPACGPHGPCDHQGSKPFLPFPPRRRSGTRNATYPTRFGLGRLPSTPTNGWRRSGVQPAG